MLQGLRRRSAITGAAVTAVLGAGALAGTAQAADVACAGGAAAFRAAITAANTNPGPDVINVTGGPCDFVFTNAATGAGVNATANPINTGELTINGNGARLVRSGAAQFRLLQNGTGVVPGPRLTINDLEFHNGLLNGAGNVFGAGIYNVFGELTLNRTRFVNNVVNGSANARGGAVFNFGGTLSAADSTFHGNAALAFGGAIASFPNSFVTPNTRGTVSVTRSAFTTNAAGVGGAIALDGDAFTLADSTLTGNTAVGAGGGGVYQAASVAALQPSSTITGTTIDSNKATGASGLGGAIYAAAGQVAVTGGSLSTNEAASAGAAYLPANTTFSSVGTKIDANKAVHASGIGGGVYGVGSAVSLKGGTLSSNTAVAAGGGYVQGGSLAVDGTTIAGNTGPSGGGGLYLNATTSSIADATLSGNKALGTGSGQGLGGGAYVNGGTATFTGGSVADNDSAVGGGGVFGSSANVTVTGLDVGANAAPSGAGLYALGGTLTAHGLQAHDNVTTATGAANLGGAILGFNTGVTVDQGSVLTGNGAGLGGGAYALGGTLTIQDSTVSDNDAGQTGGGLVTAAPLVVRRSTVSGNSAAGSAGGIYVNQSTLLVEDSTLRGNSAGFQGGGLATRNAVGTVRRSTIAANTAAFSQGAALVTGGTVTLENSTVSQNTGPRFPNTTAAFGGLGVAASAAQGQDPAQRGRVDLVSTTLADNGDAADPSPNNQILVNGAGLGAEVHATDTIVSDDDGAADSPACAVTSGGTIIDENGNLEFPGTSCGFDTTADPKLAALADNGGETETHRLLPGSAAIDLGGADCPATDQRGVTRPGGDACDAGSYETDAPETSAQGPASPTNDPEVTFSSDDENATFECQVDGGEWAPCTSPFPPEVGDGEHTVRVRAVDADGYADQSPASVTFTVDATGPVVTITSAGQQPGLPATGQATFTVDDTAESVECRVDDGEFAPCTSPYATGPLDDGEHTISVRATDELGNETIASREFTIDTAPPQTTITGGTSGTVYNPNVGWSFTSSKPGSTFECKLDGGAFTPCTSPKAYVVTPGTHTFAVRAIDANGVVDPTPATRTITYKHCTVRVGLLPNLTICV